nr:hypothetical protein [Streptomyces roseochromogenus]
MHPDVAPRPGAVVFTKRCVSAFAGSDLDLVPEPVGRIRSRESDGASSAVVSGGDGGAPARVFECGERPADRIRRTGR